METILAHVENPTANLVVGIIFAVIVCIVVGGMVRLWWKYGC